MRVSGKITAVFVRGRLGGRRQRLLEKPAPDGVAITDCP